MGTAIHVYSHGFSVSTIDRRFKTIAAAFIRNRLIVDKFQIGKAKGKNHDTYASTNYNKSLIFLPIELFDEFKIAMAGYGVRPDEYEVIFHKPKKGAPIEVNFIAPFKMSELQERCLEFVRAPVHRRVAPLQTGKGKTALALYYMCENARRTLITMNAKYIPRWLLDLTGDDAKVDLQLEDLIVVKGLAELKKYIMAVKRGELTFKVMLVSNTTMSMYIDSVLDEPKEWKSYGIKVPSDIYTILKIGFRIRDEAHEHIHFNFIFDLHTNIEKSLELSATLVYDNLGVEKMARIVYPIEDRFNQGKWDTHVAAFSVEYRLLPTTKLKWTQGWNGPYNHNALEASIMKNQVYLGKFKAMVAAMVREYYLEPVIEQGKKEVCLVYAGTKEMCTKLAVHIQAEFPDLLVNRYIGEDEYENLISADIVVTTPKSAGTGVDVPNLGVVITTVNQSSTQAVVQMVGRLRPKVGIDSRFYYLTCLDIPQNVKYHTEKLTKLKGIVKSMGVINSPYRI